MAQHPDKLIWKEETRHGISASQFGMALGFCGRIVDYVNYLRNITGTDLEFTGNASTAHGIVTEPKSRALYELLTGNSVSDGGFFLTEDRLLGCSPDGQVFYNSDEIQQSLPDDFSSESSPNSPSENIRVRIPFKSKRGRHDDDNNNNNNNNNNSKKSLPIRRSSQKKCRLLEIKSPFYALYDGSKPAYQPFGIPLHYLCQMQGQMSIADVEECDFFVYLDRPSCQVVAWRVKRSKEFWDWAAPKLREVAEWVRDGPPTWLNRSFQYETFDFSKIRVEPLIFPYNITLNEPIYDPRRFPFFEQFPNPYRQEKVNSDQEIIIQCLTNPITRFLFHNDIDDNINNEGIMEENVIYCKLEEFSYISSVNKFNWNFFASNGDTSMIDIVKSNIFEVIKPFDFNDDKVTCRLFNSKSELNDLEKNISCSNCNDNNDEKNTIKVRYFHRNFFCSLVPCSCTLTVTKSKSPSAIATNFNLRESSITSNHKNTEEPVLSISILGTSTPVKRREFSVNSTNSVWIIDDDSVTSQTLSVECYNV